MTDQVPRQFVYEFCEWCNKRGFPSRKAAKTAARHARNGSMNAYRCPNQPEGADPVWHFGHLPPDVRRGRIDKNEWRGRRR